MSPDINPKVPLKEIKPGQIFLYLPTKTPYVTALSYEEVEGRLGNHPPSLLVLKLERKEHGYVLNGNPSEVLGSDVEVEATANQLDENFIRQHLPTGTIESYFRFVRRT